MSFARDLVRSGHLCRYFVAWGWFAIFPTAIPAGQLVDIVFESGSIEADPNWSYLQDPTDPSATPRARVGSTGRAFQTGTAGSDQALFVVPGEGGTETFFQGAVWQIDPAEAVPVPTGHVIFVETETFSDVASTFSQWYKVDIAAGIRGNGLSREGGFQSDDPELALGESHLQANTNYSTDSTGVNQQKVQLAGKSLNDRFRFAGTNWMDGATSATLDETYVNQFFFRELAADGDTTPIGSRAEVHGALQDAVSPPLVAEPGEDEALFLPEQIDRIAVQLLRHGDVPNESRNFTRYDALAEGATESTGKIGIKSVRVGIVEPTDFDMSFDTTAADGAILLEHLSSRMPDDSGLTSFVEGDANGDGRITASTDGEILLAELPAGGDDPMGTARGYYDRTSGRLILEATGVARISVFSEAGNLLDDIELPIEDFGGAADVDLASSHDVSWMALANFLGASTPSRISVAIVRPGTDADDLTIEYQNVGGQSIVGELVVIPEPTGWTIAVGAVVLFFSFVRQVPTAAG